MRTVQRSVGNIGLLVFCLSRALMVIRTEMDRLGTCENSTQIYLPPAMYYSDIYKQYTTAGCQPAREANLSMPASATSYWNTTVIKKKNKHVHKYRHISTTSIVQSSNNHTAIRKINPQYNTQQMCIT